MATQSTISKIFAGAGIALGLGSLVALGMGHPNSAIALGVLTIGSEFASYIHRNA